MAEFLLRSILLGVALAMDAFSVSVTNGLRQPHMKRGRMCLIAGCYALFQFIMPLCGYLVVHTIVEYFSFLQRAAEITGFAVLVILGIKMIREGLEDWNRSGKEADEEKTENEDTSGNVLTVPTLLLQGVATSLDALSAGFAIASYTPAEGVLSSVIIMAVTFLLCMVGLRLGKKLGEYLSGASSILGGVILIVIGIKMLF